MRVIFRVDFGDPVAFLDFKFGHCARGVFRDMDVSAAPRRWYARHWLSHKRYRRDGGPVHRSRGAGVKLLLETRHSSPTVLT